MVAILILTLLALAGGAALATAGGVEIAFTTHPLHIRRGAALIFVGLVLFGSGSVVSARLLL